MFVPEEKSKHRNNWCDGCQKLKPAEELISSANGLVHRCLVCVGEAISRPVQAVTEAASKTKPKPNTVGISKPRTIPTKPVSVVASAPTLKPVTTTLARATGKSKWCNNCQKLKPVDKFTPKGNRQASLCLACANAKASSVQTKPKSQKVKTTWPQNQNVPSKRCYECQQFKPATEFVHITCCSSCSETSNPADLQNKAVVQQANSVPETKWCYKCCQSKSIEQFRAVMIGPRW